MPPIDCYAQYRRTHPTVSDEHSPVAFVHELYATLAEKLPDGIQDEIEHDVRHFLFMVTSSPSVRTDGDGTSFIPPMHWHPRTIIAAGRDLNVLRDAAKTHPPPPTAASAAEKVISYLTSANSLKLLHRFVDSRQPNLLQVPLPDGSNIIDHSTGDDDNSLLHEWMFCRIFVRFLHLPGIWFSGKIPEERLRAFGYIYGISRCLLELELERCPVKNTSVDYEEYPIDLNGPEGELLSWIKPCRDNIEFILDEIAKIAYEDHQTIASRFFPNRNTTFSLTKKEKLLRNLSPQFVHIMLDKMINKYEELMAPYPFERLVMDLLDKEDIFERLLSQEHVEDKLINKQIVPFDELDVIQGPEHNAVNIDLTYAEGRENPIGLLLENFIYKVSAGISLVNRQRRNFRLMREWLKDRPWFLIVHAYNSSIPGNEWQAGAIKEFCQKGLRDVYDGNPLVPSDPTNIRGNLFGIYPFDTNDPTIKGRDIFNCGVCDAVSTGGNEPTNTFVVLDCPKRHSFHLGCLMWVWDREIKYTYSCPTCGAAPELAHERLGMSRNSDDPCFGASDPTFVDNVFGYVVRHPKPPNATPLFRYDMPHRGADSSYWQRENLLSTAMDDADVFWRGEMINDELKSRRGIAKEFDRVVRQLGITWRLRNRDLLQSEDYVMEDGFDASRFAPSVEVAWLRARRRKRDRKRRRKIYEAGQGLQRYMP